MDTPEQGYPPSELAKAFRDSTPQEYGTLKEDIKQNGQLVPITLRDREVVDGRQRQSICFELDITPIYQELPDDVDPARFLMAMHRKYRDLSKDDRAVAASKLSSWSRPGGDRKSEDYRDHSAHVRNDLTQEEAARSLGVSVRLVSKASTLLSEDSPAAPELQEAVSMGEVKVSDAYRVRAQPEEVQEQALARFRSGQARTVTAAAKAITGERLADRPAPQPAGPYRTVVVDPPWPVTDRDRERQAKAPKQDRPHMTVAEIAGMELPLHDDAFVFLWNTQEHLPDAFRILERWGLKYRFTMLWQKQGGVQPAGSCQHDVEFVVVGARGEPRFTTDRSFSSVFAAPCADPTASHSVKPGRFYDLLGRFTPGPRLELPEECVKHWPVWQEPSR